MHLISKHGLVAHATKHARYAMMHIAAVQLDICWEDRAANHARVRKLLDPIDLPQNSLVILPEMFDTGFSMNTAVTDPGSPSASEIFCRELAAKRHVAVLAGVVSRTNDGQFANEAVAFSPDGVELVRYRKMQPFTLAGEHMHYEAGNSPALFEWQGLRIAPLICYDLRFPELFRPAIRHGPELFIVVANWPTARSEHWVRLLQARAIENQAYVLGVNRTGSDPEFQYDGRTALFDPLGKVVFQAGADPQAFVADIDAQHVRSWREQFPALRDAKHLQT